MTLNVIWLPMMKVILALTLFFGLVCPVVAETPGEAVREVIDSMKLSRSELPLLQRVDWEQAFVSRENYSGWKNYNSAQSMREFYFNRLRPGYLLEHAERVLQKKGQPPLEEKAKLPLKSAEATLSNSLGNLLKDIKYSIHNASVSGNKAKVKVTYDWGRVVENEIELIHTENSWLLTNPEISLFLGLDKIEEMRQITNQSN